MNDNENKEQKVKELFDNIECKSFDEKFAEIKPRLNMKIVEKKSKIKNSFILKTVSVAASLVLFLSIGLLVYFNLKKDDDIIDPDYRYEDKNIDSITGDENDLLAITGLYLPDLSILSDKQIKKGIHNESKEIVFIEIKGIDDRDEMSFRELIIRIILQPKYFIMDENRYNDESTFEIVNKIISFSEQTYEEPFYSSYLGFKLGEIRYYIDYQSIEENDIETFLQDFLK